MRKLLTRLMTRMFDYSTRHHMMERYRSMDFKFLGALVALILLTILAMKLYGMRG